MKIDLKLLKKSIDRVNNYNVVKKTPLQKLDQLSQRFDNHIFVKREDLQLIHSFKIRGAMNRFSKLNKKNLSNGVIAASAGNHAQGVALSAKKIKCRAVIVMPEITPLIKVEAVKSHGAEVVLHGDNFAAAMAHAFDPPLEASFVNGGSIRLDDFLEGGITPLDFFRVLPFGDGVLQVQMTGALLSEILSYGQLQKGDGAYLQRYGLEQGINELWNIGDRVIESDALYWVATSEFLLRGYDIPFLTPDNPGVRAIVVPKEGEVAADIRQSIIQYLKNEKIN